MLAQREESASDRLFFESRNDGHVQHLGRLLFRARIEHPPKRPELSVDDCIRDAGFQPLTD
jgi:hypothetical protein